MELLPFLFLLLLEILSAILLTKTLRSISKQGRLSCLAAFTIVWWLSYALPVAIEMVSPDIIDRELSLVFMTSDDWLISAVVAWLGYIVFVLGYKIGETRYRRSLIRLGTESRSANKISVGEKNKRPNSTVVTYLLLACLALQLYPIWLAFTSEISVDFVHRTTTWDAVQQHVLVFFSVCHQLTWL